MTQDEPRFVLYEVRIDDAPGFVRTNADLIDEVPDAARPYALCIQAPLLRPTIHGMPGEGEYDTLAPLEDGLIEALAPAALAGTVISAGVRSWYFYSDDATRDGDAALEVGRRMAPAYKLDYGATHDPEWSQYLEWLYPNPVEWRWIHDLELIRAIQGHGDAGDDPREITHWAYFADPKQQSSYATELRSKGYTIDELYSEGPDERPHCVKFSHHIAPMEIQPYTKQLMLTADELGGEYDGWETRIVKPETRDEGPPRQRGVWRRLKRLFGSREQDEGPDEQGGSV